MRFRNYGVAASLMAAATFGCSGAEAQNNIAVPEANREFRAAWVATVANIDWPSRKGLTTEQQKSEIIAILDKSVELNLNALVLQVRPAADAIYDSKIEPWSDVITGEMGKAPEPFYDPLTMWVEEGHKRGIEIHCWFNPYRSLTPGSKGVVSDNHINKTNPEISKKYGEYYWLNPTDKRVQDLSMSVVLDVVNRYDIDGVHMDDYFYPYPSYANGADFPDDDTWAAYQESGGKLNRADWRRDAVNQFVERFYKDVKKAKPHVKVGISPFGIGRPGLAPNIASGFDQYSELYADAQLWLNEGWVDYYTPQLYWGLASPQPYLYLLNWWIGENDQDRHIWPGLYTGKFAGKPETLAEVTGQIAATRFLGATGHVHFSMKALLNNVNGISDLLKSTVYAEPALIPASTWIEDDAPAKPTLTKTDVTPADGSTSPVTTLNWKMGAGEEPWLWTLYTQTGKKWSMQVLPATSSTLSLQPDEKGAIPTNVALSAVDRNGNESEKAIVTISIGSPEAVSTEKKVDQVQ